MRSAVDVKGLKFKYTRTWVLENITFNINVGDYVGLIGPNGGGKTTLLKLLLGLEQGIGEINLFGQSLEKFKNWGKIGYLAQKSPVSQSRFPISVEEVVGMGLFFTTFSKELTPKHMEQIQAALIATGTQDLAKRIFHDLSMGQQQRVLLARALVSSPKLLILDEPSAALDAESRETFFALLGELNSKRGVTILLITHDTAEVGKYISKFMYVDRELVFFGTKEEFCQSEKMAAKLGSFAQHAIDHLHNYGHCPLGCTCDHERSAPATGAAAPDQAAGPEEAEAIHD